MTNTEAEHPKQAKPRNRFGIVSLSAFLAVSLPLFSLVFSSVQDVFESYRTQRVERLRENRERIAEFSDVVRERRAAIVNLLSSLQRNVDPEEIRRRSEAYDRVFIASSGPLYRAQNLAHNSFDPAPDMPGQDSSAVQVDDAFYHLLQSLQGLDAVSVTRSTCNNAKSSRPDLLQKYKCATRDIALEDIKIQSMSRQIQLCQNQLTVELYNLNSSRRGLSFQLASEIAGGDKIRWGCHLARLAQYCPKPPRMDDDAATWETFAGALERLQSGIASSTPPECK